MNDICARNLEIANRLKCARVAIGMTQTQLADTAHISRSTYNLIENGKRELNYTYLATLCEVLDITPNWLFGIVPNDTPDNATLYLLELMCKLDQDSRQQIIDYAELIVKANMNSTAL